MSVFARRWRRTLLWSLLLALGCGGGTDCGGGCGGCGAGGCMAPIPGGFLPDLRRPNALAAKITPSGFDFIEEQAKALVSQQAQSFDVPCVENHQKIDLLFTDLDADVYVCELSGDNACSAADADPALRTVASGFDGPTCGVEVKILGMRFSPVANTDGTVDVRIDVDISIDTGKIPLKADTDICDLKCNIELDTDRGAKPVLTMPVTVQLRTSPAPHNLLTFNVAALPQIKNLIDNEDLLIKSDGGGCSFTCDVINIGFVKDEIFKQVQKEVDTQLRDAIDQARCEPCDPEATVDTCSAGAKCDAELAVCINGSSNANPRVCPPIFPGVEGRISLAEAMGDMLASGAGAMDLSIVAGGPPPSQRVENGGLVLSMLGGSATPERSACINFERFQHAPAETLNFDTAANEHVDGLPDVGPYDFGLTISDYFMDEMAFNAWAAGALCAQLGTESVEVLSSGLFSTFIPSLSVLTQKQDVPMLIALRPRHAPQVTIGRGTTQAGPNGTRVPKDPLLTFDLKDFQIDFYAQLEERDSRLFSLIADVSLPLALEFNPVDNTVLPVLAKLDTLFTNVRVENSEMLADDPAQLAAIVSQLVGLVQPQIGGALQPIALPDTQGMRLEVKGARGTLANQAGEKGFQHMALFMKLTATQPLTLAVDTEAEVVSVDPATYYNGRISPSVARRARLSVRGKSLQHSEFKGYEFSYRVDRGLWTTFVAGPELEIASPLFAFEGRHTIEVRAREIGEPGTVDRTPERVAIVIDELAPEVALATDAAAGILRTIARDHATPDDELTFRYRAPGADWSEWGPRQVFALDAVSALEVEVRDNAAHVASARWGAAVRDAADVPRTAADEGAGCAHATAGLGAFAAALLAARRRRR